MVHLSLVSHSIGSLPPRRQARLRRWIEQVAALLTLFAMSVPMLLVAGALGLTLGSPLLFRQTRIGLNVKTFTIVKFRTMTDSRDASGTLLSDEQRPVFVRIVKKAFSQRRKMMLKLLKTEWPAEKLAQAFTELNISPMERAEKLSLEQFVALTKILSTV